MRHFGTRVIQTYISVALLPLIVYLVPTLASKLFVSKGIMSFLTNIPYMGFLAVGFLGYRLNQTRILFLSIFFFMSYLLLQHIHSGELKLSWLDNSDLIKSLAIGTPLTILITFIQKETRLKGWRTAGRFALALYPFLFLAILYKWFPNGFNSFVGFTFFDISWLKIPQLAIPAYLGLLSAIFFITDQKISLFVIATMIAMFPCLTAYQISLMEGVSQRNMVANTIFASSVVCGIIADSMYRMYWQRVYLDELTGIPNRRALDEFLYTLDGEYSIAMVDIDYFKKFNDAYGHDEGDNVLRLVARTLFRDAKVKIYRYGGEEFCAVFEGVNSEDSYMFANKMRRLVHGRKFYIRSKKSDPIKGNLLNVHFGKTIARYTTFKDKKKSSGTEKPQNQNKVVEKTVKSKSGALALYEEKTERGVERYLKISVSIGLASPVGEHQSPFDVIKEADKALYQAKEKGRNCVAIANRPEYEMNGNEHGA